MSIKEKIIASLTGLVDDLVTENYQSILCDKRNGRLTEEEIKEAFVEYGGKLTKPPKTAYYSNALRMYKLKDYPEYDIAFDLWIDGERSDLSLMCTVVVDEHDNVKSIKIDDIHAL